MTLSQNQSQVLEAKPFINNINEEQDKLSSCEECTSNFEKEAGILKSGLQKPSLLHIPCKMEVGKGSTQLPHWMQSLEMDTHHKDDLVELRRKWHRLCQSLHHPKPNQMHISSSIFNNQSISCKSYDSASSHRSISFRESSLEPKFSSFESQFGKGTFKDQVSEVRLDSLKNTENKEVKITLGLGNPVFSEPLTRLARRREEMMDPRDLCKRLQENVPWQSDIIPLIVDSLVNPKLFKKNGIWFLIQGNDSIGKRRLALAISESLCGSVNNLIHMNTRERENRTSQCSKILSDALKNHGKCVFLLEDLDCADTQFIEFLINGLESRNFEETIWGDVSFSQSIFIITTRGSSIGQGNRIENPNSVIQMKLQFEETISNSGSPNSDHKRKAEWDLSNMNKTLKTNEKDDVSSLTEENQSNKKEFSRQISSNMLDLNIRADGNEEDGDEIGQSNPVSSVLNQEIAKNRPILNGLLKSIENQFVFDKNPVQICEITENFLKKLKGSYEEVCGSEGKNNFSVEEEVLKEILYASGSFLNGLFEKWLKDVFQTSLETVKNGEKQEKVSLCLGGRRETVLDLGFMGSSLPKTFQVAFKD